MNGIPGGFVRMKLHPDGHTSALYHSEGFQRLVGMNAEELMKIYGDDSTSGVHPDDLHIVHEAIQTMQKQGETQNVSYRLRNGSGGYTAVTIFGKKHINSAGEIYLDVYYANASEQQKREDIQIELLDNLPCGAALYELENNQLKVIHLNRHYWEMVDREPKDYDDISVLSVVHPDDQALIAKSVGEAIRDHHNAICDIRIKCGSGSYRMFHVEGRVIPQDDGKYMICASYTCDTEA